MENENVIDILFDFTTRKICHSKKEKEKILGEKRITLDEIIFEIENPKIKSKLLKYEEQNNIISTAENQEFFCEGFNDALKLLK